MGTVLEVLGYALVVRLLGAAAVVLSTVEVLLGLAA
jgi:hypothetical protein